MPATYYSSSPYYITTIKNNKLDILVKRSFPFEADDLEYKISEVFNQRPDYLAYDLYKNANLWWVFAARNPNVLIDPVFDFVTGTTIFIPKITTLQKTLEI